MRYFHFLSLTTSIVLCTQSIADTTPQTTLSASVETLGLSVKDPSLNAALAGTPRLITITNTGTNSASNVSYTASPALPSGTSITPATCGTIAPANTCVLTITPGSTSSAKPGDTAPTPITLSISGTNTNTLTPTIAILTYGSVYQAGYIYAVDDTTPTTGSIGGKVAALTDQAKPFSPGSFWSSNGDGSAGNIAAIYGISHTSTTSDPDPIREQVAGQIACNGNLDGACNSNNIYIYYQTTASDHPISTSLYATGLCKATIGGYNDWYLPAICELGNSSIAGCSTDGIPTLQNMQSNLADKIIGKFAPNQYWSSTEHALFPTPEAWAEILNSVGGSMVYGDKNSPFGVRCSRALTP